MQVVKPEHLVPIQGLVGLVNNRTPRHHLVPQLGLREVDYLALNRPAMLRHLVVPRRQGLASVLLMQELDFSELPQSRQRAFSAPRRLHQHNPPAAFLVLLLKQDLVTRILLVLALALLPVVGSLVSQNQVYLVTLVIRAVLVQAVLPTLVSLVVVNKTPLLLELLHNNSSSNSKHRLLIPSAALATIKLSNKLAMLLHLVALGPPRRSNPKLVYSAPLLRPVLVEARLVRTTNRTINSSQHPASSLAIQTIKLALVRCLVRSLLLQAHRSLVPTLRILVTTLEGVYSALHSTITVVKTSSLRVLDYSAA